VKKDSNLLKNNIKEYAEKIGINALGFLKAEPFFHNTKRKDYSKEMGYLSSFIKENNQGRERSEFNEYKTILTVLVNYPNPLFDKPEIPEKLTDQGYGEVSASSWGIDYHLVLKDILLKLAEFIQNNSSLKYYYAAVDTVNFSEREIAVLGGLGWIGKNSCLINKEQGSFVFIGELFLDIEIEPDINIKNQHTDFCGECNLCVKSCPTGAIDGINRVIDTRLCLSQQTQEKEISNELVKNKIKEEKYIFGCDICQKVCPWNKKQRDYNLLFRPEPGKVYIDLNELILESNKSFQNKYGKLSGSWRGKKTWQRNARIIRSTDFDV
jgi:epoxyqueuosine reductase